MTEPDPLAVAAMIAYCGWDPTSAGEKTVTLDGNGSELLTLPSLHVTAVSSVTISDTYYPQAYLSTDSPASIGPTGSVRWSENGCLLYRGWCSGGVWPEGVGNVAVTFTGGYDYPPDDLMAALESIGRRTTSAVFGATSQRMGTASVTWAPSASGLLLVEQMVFDRYRLPRAA